MFDWVFSEQQVVEKIDKRTLITLNDVDIDSKDIFSGPNAFKAQTDNALKSPIDNKDFLSPLPIILNPLSEKNEIEESEVPDIDFIFDEEPLLLGEQDLSDKSLIETVALYSLPKIALHKIDEDNHADPFCGVMEVEESSSLDQSCLSEERCEYLGEFFGFV